LMRPSWPRTIAESMDRRDGLAGVPSLLFFRNGQIAARRIGELSEHDLEDWIESLLAED
jgi:thiol:disulfide interchange protein